MAADLPKPRAKRLARARELLTTEQKDLTATEQRYMDVVERGADALSEYDRTIAYGGNAELARASTLALLYNQIAWRRGRVDCLQRESGRAGGRGR